MPFTRPKGIDLNRLNKYLTGELHNSGAAEIMARFTELKNYFGLKEGESLTPEIWDYAQRHYITDVADNSMKNFFKAGNNKFPSHPFLLSWLNRSAPIFAGVTLSNNFKSFFNNE